MRIFQGIFVPEGTSDGPLASLVERLFAECGVFIRLTAPDYSRLDARVSRDVKSKVDAALRLTQGHADLVVVHRDADAAGLDARRAEISSATIESLDGRALLPIIPIRLTEAWLLLVEPSIRFVAANPNGRTPLGLPKAGEVERLADPKRRLQEVLLLAADETGRRKRAVERRFSQHRSQLLERLDINGPVRHLIGWRALEDAVAGARDLLLSRTDH